MRYVKARIQLYQREETYRIYLTDAVKILSENTTHHIGISGAADIGTQLSERYYDVVNPVLNSIKEDKKQEQEEPQSAEQFAANMMKRAIKKRKIALMKEGE